MSETLLPPNAHANERSIEAAAGRLGAVATPVRDVWNPDTCPANLLPWLAWAFSVDQWDAEWTDAQKREAIKASYQVHRQKGTIGAVKRALAAIGFEIRVIEWFEEDPPGPPGTFRLEFDIDQVGASLLSIEKVMDMVDAAKNLRSHLADVRQFIRTRSSVAIAAVPLVGNEIEVSFGNFRALDGAWTLDGSKRLHGIAI